MMLLLLGTALAGEIPTMPEPRAAIAGQCEEATPVTEPCRAVLVPTSKAADLLDVKVWGEGLYKHYTLDKKIWEAKEAKLRQQVWIRAAEGLLVGFAAGVITYAAVEAR